MISVSTKSKKFKKCIYIFLGLILVLSTIIGYRNFKVHQLKEKIRERENDPVLYVQHTKVKEYPMGADPVKYIKLEGEEVPLFVERFLKLPFSYERSYRAGNYGRTFSNSKDYERIDINNMNLTLTFEKYMGGYYFAVDINRHTASYKVVSDQGEQFYNWLLSQ